MPDTRGADSGGKHLDSHKARATSQYGVLPIRASDDPLVASLRAAYDATLADPVPQALADLLRRLE